MKAFRLLLVALALTGLTGVLYAQEQEDQPAPSKFEELLQKADSQPSFSLKADYYAQAIDGWETGKDSLLKKRLAYERLAMCFLAMNQAVKAQEQMSFAIEIDTTSVTAHAGMGHILAMQARYDKALAETDIAITLTQNDQRAPLYYQRGVIEAMGIGEMNHALSDLTTAYALAKESGLREVARKSIMRRGIIKCHIKDYSGGEADMLSSQDFARKSDRPEFLIELGKCYQMENELNKAVASYSTFIRMAVEKDEKETKPGEYPRLAETYCRRGEAREEAGHDDSSLADYSRGIYLHIEGENTPLSPFADQDTAYDMADCYYRRAMLYEGKGEKLFAGQDYEQACKLKNSRACEKIHPDSAKIKESIK